MNEVNVRKAVRNLAMAKKLIEEADKLLTKESFSLCTGNILDYGWYLSGKNQYHENGIEELSELLGKAVIEYDGRRFVEKNGSSFYEYVGGND